MARESSPASVAGPTTRFAAVTFLVAAATDWGEWGTIPAWVGAVATGGALLMTSFTFLRDRRDRVRQQAHQVYAWETRPKDRRADEPLAVTATVYNRSDAPIWNVTLTPRRAGRPYEGAVVTQSGAPDIRPNKETAWRWTVQAADAGNMNIEPLLRFRDAAGREWKKTGSRLTRVGRWRR
jgi:hypothetical protein